MAGSLKRVCWDACAWIALIQKEKIRDDSGRDVEDRESLCRSVIRAAEAKKIEIATSALSYVEVCKKPAVRQEGEDKIANFFEHEFVLPVNLDRYVGERARELMLAGYSKLKPPDAVHLATAAIANAEEMHTFDDKLLALDLHIDKADGTKLKIKKPGIADTPAPLLEWQQEQAAAVAENLEGAAEQEIDLSPELDNNEEGDEEEAWPEPEDAAQPASEGSQDEEQAREDAPPDESER